MPLGDEDFGPRLRSGSNAPLRSFWPRHHQERIMYIFSEGGNAERLLYEMAPIEMKIKSLNGSGGGGGSGSSRPWIFLSHGS